MSAPPDRATLPASAETLWAGDGQSVSLGSVGMRLSPGDVVDERYRLLERLATGGMGTVWRAVHLELDGEVALKLLSGELLKRPGAETRFRREARALARLKSPHIVQVRDFGVFEGEPYLVMELLEGEDLAHRLADRGALTADECVVIVDAIAKALQVAHDAHIVHRDLKPGNVFLERIGDEEIVKVLDFGIAKDLSQPRDPASSASTLGVVGSPAYMSPEQVWGQELTPAADVWALGVISLEMLTGHNPFHDEVLAKVFDRVIKDPIPKPSSLNPEVSPALDAVIERALRRDVDERFASARQLARALRAAAAGAAGGVTPETPVSDALEGSNRRRRLFLMALVALVMAALGAARWLRSGSDVSADRSASAAAAASGTADRATPSASPLVVSTPTAPPTTSTTPVVSAPRTGTARQRIKPPASSPAPAATRHPLWGVPTLSSGP